MSDWKDATSYAQGQRGRIEPETYELSTAGLRVVITRRFGVEGRWFLICRPWFDVLDLGDIDVNKAKEIALGLVDGEIRKLMNEWGKFWLTRNG